MVQESHSSKAYRTAQPGTIYFDTLDEMEPCTVACFLRLGGTPSYDDGYDEFGYDEYEYDYTSDDYSLDRDYWVR